MAGDSGHGVRNFLIGVGVGIAICVAAAVAFSLLLTASA